MLFKIKDDAGARSRSARGHKSVTDKFAMDAEEGLSVGETSPWRRAVGDIRKTRSQYRDGLPTAPWDQAAGLSSCCKRRKPVGNQWETSGSLLPGTSGRGLSAFLVRGRFHTANAFVWLRPAARSTARLQRWHIPIPWPCSELQDTLPALPHCRGSRPVTAEPDSPLGSLGERRRGCPARPGTPAAPRRPPARTALAAAPRRRRGGRKDGSSLVRPSVRHGACGVTGLWLGVVVRLPQPLLLGSARGASRGAPGPSLPAGSGVPGGALGAGGGPRQAAGGLAGR